MTCTTKNIQINKSKIRLNTSKNVIMADQTIIQRDARH